MSDREEGGREARRYIDPAADVPIDKEMRDEIISIASSDASMDRQALISRIVALETAEVVRTRAITRNTAANRNQAIHNRVLAATTGQARV